MLFDDHPPPQESKNTVYHKQAYLFPFVSLHVEHAVVTWRLRADERRAKRCILTFAPDAPVDNVERSEDSVAQSIRVDQEARTVDELDIDGRVCGADCEVVCYSGVCKPRLGLAIYGLAMQNVN